MYTLLISAYRSYLSDRRILSGTRLACNRISVQLSHSCEKIRQILPRNGLTGPLTSGSTKLDSFPRRKYLAAGAKIFYRLESRMERLIEKLKRYSAILRNYRVFYCIVGSRHVVSGFRIRSWIFYLLFCGLGDRTCGDSRENSLIDFVGFECSTKWYLSKKLISMSININYNNNDNNKSFISTLLRIWNKKYYCKKKLNVTLQNRVGIQ